MSLPFKILMVCFNSNQSTFCSFLAPTGYIVRSHANFIAKLRILFPAKIKKFSNFVHFKVVQKLS